MEAFEAQRHRNLGSSRGAYRAEALFCMLYNCHNIRKATLDGRATKAKKWQAPHIMTNCAEEK
jgi:hypothetical protein